MTDAAFAARLAAVLAEEAAEPERDWWLSFADPEANRNLGVCIVRARGIVGASREAHVQGCNPGGELAGWPIDDVDDPVTPFAALPRNVLLTVADLDAAGFAYRRGRPGRLDS